MDAVSIEVHGRLGATAQNSIVTINAGDLITIEQLFFESLLNFGFVKLTDVALGLSLISVPILHLRR